MKSASPQALLVLSAVIALAGCSGPVSSGSLSFPQGDSHPPAVALAKLDPQWDSPEPKAYLAKLAGRVDDEWYWRVSQQSRSAMLPVSGTVVLVDCTLTSDGRIKNATATDTASDLAHQLCLEALQANQPYGKWSEAMVAQLGQEQHLTLRFHYVWRHSDFDELSRSRRMNRDVAVSVAR